MRMCFLETVAGVPGMVAAMLRHLRSLRTMRRDNGWIHTLLEEAENERMHLLTFLQLRQPGPLFRGAVLVTQGARGCVVVVVGAVWQLIMHPCIHSFFIILSESSRSNPPKLISALNARSEPPKLAPRKPTF